MTTEARTRVDGAGRPPGGGGRRRLDRPWVILAAAGTLVVLYALLTPQYQEGRSGDARLTTYSTQPLGAKLLYETAARLGWSVRRVDTAAVRADSTTIEAVLAPALPFRRDEVHALLQQVRAGAALLLVLPGGASAFDDSLHVFTSLPMPLNPPPEAAVDSCGESSELRVPFWYQDNVTMDALRWSAPAPAGLVEFAHVTRTGKHAATRPAVVGFPFGGGRIVIASDPDFFRNDALRVCRYGLSVLAVRALEYLRAGGAAPRTHLAFDEYHQGFGAQPGTVSAIGMFLTGSSSGHFLFQLLGAGMLLLLAAAPRVLAPYDPPRVQRRSPLEHVDALARAYAQVGGTRTAATRLVRGVRRRIGLAAARATAGRSDEAFLDWAEHAVPSLAPDVHRVRHALQTRVSSHELTAIGESLAHIESSLTRRGS
ncbi:MAG TPA: DUF4350 domain-containing protein [Gemmatimonadaceae bacterium]